jgi:NADH dehydrogenase
MHPPWNRIFLESHVSLTRRSMNNILVLGGTGFVGRSVCEMLFRRSGGGGRIVVPTRRPSRAGHIQMLPTVEIMPADVFDDAQLRRLVRGRDAVIQLIAVLHGSEAEFQRVHVDLPRRLAEACFAGGVRRVVHVSSLGASESAPSMYLRSKARGEVGLLDAPLDLTIFRPSVIFGEGDRFINQFAKLQRVFPVMPLAGADAKFQPVWVEDVAEAIVRSLDERSTIGQVFECTGPTAFTLKQLVMLAGRWSGHARPVIALPDALGRIQATLMEWAPGVPLMSRDNLDSMKIDNVASGTAPGLDTLGITPRSLESVMPGFLSQRDGIAKLDPLRALARRN